MRRRRRRCHRHHDLPPPELAHRPAPRTDTCALLTAPLRWPWGGCRFKDVSFEWDRLDRRGYKAPFVPKIKDSLDTSNFDPYPDDEPIKPYRGNQELFVDF